MENTTLDLSEFFEKEEERAVIGTLLADLPVDPLNFKKNVERVRRKYGERYDINPENILAEVAKCAFFDPKDLFTDTGKLRGLHELDAQTTAAIAGMKITQVGGSTDGWVEQIQYRFTDKLKALETLGKFIGLFDKQDPNDKGEKVVQSDNDRARKVAYVLEKLINERLKNSQGNVATHITSKES